MDGLTSSDVALLTDRNDGMWGGGAFFWIFALLILAGGNFGFSGNKGDYVTSSELANQLNAQTTQNQLQGLAVETSNNNFRTAELINAQTNLILQQNNTNLINAIQGFNQLGLQMQQLSAQMNECCCSVKTMMLENRLEDAQAKNVAQQGIIDNFNQTQTILNALGRFVAWTPSGSQAAAGT